MEITNGFYNSYIVMLASNLFKNGEIDYLCYQFILNKYKGVLDEFN